MRTTSKIILDNVAPKVDTNRGRSTLLGGTRLSPQLSKQKQMETTNVSAFLMTKSTSIGANNK